MSIERWLPGMVLSIDPDATLDYVLDLSEWLDGDTVSAATVQNVNNLAASIRGTGDDFVTFRVSDVVDRGSVTIQVSTTAGQSDNFTVNYKAVQK